MSRFFAARSSGSEDESSDEAPVAVPKPAPTVASRAQFLFSDEEDEDTKRVVRSQKDKRFDEISSIAKQLKNHKKIKDMSKILTEFENLGRAFTKAKNVVDKEGIPTTFIKCLVELEDFIKENWEDTEGRKKLSKLNAKALTALRQKVKKYNKTFENDIEKYRENPLISDDGEEEDAGRSDDSDEDDDIVLKKPEPQAAKQKADKFEDSDSEFDDMDSDVETDSSSDSDLDIPQGGKVTAAMFLKRERDEDEEKTKEKKLEKERQKKRRQKVKEDQEEEDEGEEWEQVKSSHTIEKTRALFAKDTEINHAVILKKLHEILGARGKKGTDRTDQIEYLKDLRKIAEKNNLGVAMSIKIMFNIIASIFDYNPNAATCMKPEMWKSCLEYVNELLIKLVDNPNVTVGENIAEDAENLEDADAGFKIRGCILIAIERTDDEFTKMLQGCDCHSTEYVERLKDEITMTLLISRVMKYLEDHDAAPSMICRVYLRFIEHIYYKLDMVRMKEMSEERKLNKTSDEEEVSVDQAAASTASQMEGMCQFIYSKDDSNRIRTRAMLCHVYFLALHDRWYEARDLMLMSHLQENIGHSDIPTQILYNRTMVQLGLCAFRHGMIKDAHNALHDVQSSGKAKELLAQGLMQQRQHERNLEQEKIERRRLVPFHMHINLELLECVYLTSAMLLEIPHMAAREFEHRRRMISKSFHHQLKLSDRQPLVGPPESMREHVVAASKEMSKGNWRECADFILAVKVWNLFDQAEEVKKMLKRKIQEESLRTYLFSYNSVYDSISMNTLAAMFELDRPVVHSIISKMIINSELQASWDEPTQTVVMHRGAEPSRLQSLALQLADKISTLVDNNERVLDTKHQFNYRDRQGQGRYRPQRSQQVY
ncbi:eukaryotic translation initiation factor 3 subunit C-like [Dendronephthya gigantea]|uniref:eukaryotic translation initiation factor 3 subunit C-like n=1 Tax=Dendronephthya gigantea TaxID=151771 RepID=UPI00106D5416|nr:eukaryotic translation initiation factor 3 subunit C-like [Dendronephthya gigantea]